MNETAFETIAQAAVALKLDFSSEEFAGFAEGHGLSEDEIEVVRSVFAYLKEKKQQTTVMTLLKMSRLPTKEPKTFDTKYQVLSGAPSYTKSHASIDIEAWLSYTTPVCSFRFF